MLRRNLMIVIGALLLAGLAATMAEAGETRRAGKKPAVTDEDEKGRKADRSARVRTPSKPSRSKKAAPAPVRRDTVRQDAPRRPEVKKPIVRKPIVRKPEVRKPVARKPEVRRSRVVSGYERARPTSRVVVRTPVRRPTLRWVPGHYEERVHQVWVPGTYRMKHVPARYAKRKGWLGITWRYLVEPARTVKVRVAGHYREESVQVWVPGYWTRSPAPHRGYRPHR